MKDKSSSREERAIECVGQTQAPASKKLTYKAPFVRKIDIKATEASKSFLVYEASSISGTS